MKAKRVVKFAIGVDLGGTNARVALVNARARIVDSLFCRTRHVSTARIFIPWVVEQARELIKRNGLKVRDVGGVGIGAPGPVNPDSGLIYFLPNLPGWKNVSIAREVKHGLGCRAVRVDNDGNAMAQGEFLFGAAKGYRDAIFLTLGTGIGGGILINGRLHHGHTFSACEAGHMRHRDGTARCACGSTGCIETEIGNGYLLRKAQKDLDKGVKTRVRDLAARDPKKKLRLEHITRAAAAGDRYAVRFWAKAGDTLGDFLGGICNLLNPEVIVIGGGVIGAGRFLMTPIKTAIRKYSFPLACRSLRVVPARLGADAGIIGAASLIFAGEKI